MVIFKKFTSIKISSMYMTIISCAISYALVSGVEFVNAISINQAFLRKPLIVSAIAIVIAIIISTISALIYTSNRFTKWMIRLFHRTPNDDIWLDILDFQNGSNLKVYLKNKDYYIIGHYKAYEEKGNDSWFAISGFGKFRIADSEIMKPSYIGNDKIVTTFRLSDVECIEIF